MRWLPSCFTPDRIFMCRTRYFHCRLLGYSLQLEFCRKKPECEICDQILGHQSTCCSLCRTLGTSYHWVSHSRQVTNQKAQILTNIRFAHGPEHAWNNMMKDSCNGFSTRINMDTRKWILNMKNYEEKIDIDPF
jgi:hypothetical protein